MILATIKSSRLKTASERFDGELVVISPDRSVAARLPSTAQGSVLSLRAALDDWENWRSRLQETAAQLTKGAWKETVPVSSCDFMAPLPRAWAFLDGSAFIQHIILVRKARGAEPPEDLFTVPLMYQGTSDNFLGPRDPIPLLDEAHGMDFEGELVVVTRAVPAGVTPDAAEQRIELVLMMNDVSLRNLIPREMATGFGFLHGKPPSSLAPFALTLDELGADWSGGRVHLPLKVWLNGELVGQPNAGEMHFSFGQLIAHAAKTRPLSAGTLIGSGTVSNKDEAAGCTCLAEKRMLEKIHTGNISTPFMKGGDRIRMEVQRDGVSLFGAIDQEVMRASGTSRG